MQWLRVLAWKFVSDCHLGLECLHWMTFFLNPGSVQRMYLLSKIRLLQAVQLCHRTWKRGAAFTQASLSRSKVLKLTSRASVDRQKRFGSQGDCSSSASNTSPLSFSLLNSTRDLSSLLGNSPSQSPHFNLIPTPFTERGDSFQLEDLRENFDLKFSPRRQPRQ